MVHTLEEKVAGSKINTAKLIFIATYRWWTKTAYKVAQ